MKSKLLMFATALLSLSVIGLVHLSSEAKTPGQVGNAPRCTVEPIGNRGNTSVDLTTQNRPNLAFSVTNSVAKVGFKVTGSKDCKVQVTINSFHAPALDGKPWNKQILYKQSVKTRVFTKGTYTMETAVPTQPKQNMCYYQVDLTYGTGNVLPIIAYGHGTIQGCIKKPTPPTPPSAACNTLTVSQLSRTSFNFQASATTANGARITGYVFQIFKNGALVDTKSVNSSSESVNYTYTQNEPGSYSVRTIVKSSIGDLPVTANCTKPFIVNPEEKPGIKITKLVEGVKYKQVNVNVEYSYQIAVTNTGNKDLTNAVVTDTPEKGVTLVSADQGSISDNKWTHTIPSLKIGETMNFTLKAKVPEYLAGRITNTVCVDTPDVPGAPDDCDTADVDVPEESKVIVCNPETGKTITVEKKDESKYVPVGSEECKVKETPTPETPKAEALPTTGPAEAFAQLFGAASLASAGAYYLTSRRQ